MDKGKINLMSFIDSLHGRENTKKTYACLFEKWIKPRVMCWFIEKDLETLAERWYSEGLSPRTIKSLVTLSARYIVWSGGEPINTKRIISNILRRDQTKPLVIPTKTEIERFLAQCRGTKLYLPVCLSLYTGMRRGEVFGLYWDDVDFIKGEILIQRSHTLGYGDGPTKNGKSRTVPISKKLEQVLLGNMPVNSDNYMRVVRKPFDPSPCLKKACADSGIEEIKFHTLRHTFATLALESGRSPRQVQQVLGHSSLSTTLDLYWGLTKNKMDMEFI
jgi:integrase